MMIVQSSSLKQRIRQRFVNEGIEAAIHRKKHCRYKPTKLDGKGETHLVALCSGIPLEGMQFALFIQQ
jgi:hypothetical protein